MAAACRLYLISPPQIDLPVFATQLREALSGGDVACFQLRLKGEHAKGADDDTIREAVRMLMPICKEKDIPFILNDRVDLAKELGCDGVHLGQEDLETTSIEAVRKTLGANAVIGVSAHASKHLALEAADEGVDYVAFGAFYPTASKPQKKIDKWGVPTLDILTWWQEMVEVPCVAIGGMKPDYASDVAAAGADFIAAITAIWDDPKGPAIAVATFNAAIADGLARRPA